MSSFTVPQIIIFVKIAVIFPIFFFSRSAKIPEIQCSLYQLSGKAMRVTRVQKKQGGLLHEIVRKEHHEG